ncbi:TPA: hypothetical protein NV830_001162 [Escherichia coli]|nr:hypothetical protein [Escherichia coli]HCJ8922378.1 hypothetical protein [Escherichia coli]
MSTTITNLPETSKVNGSDYLVLDQSDKTVKSTVSNFLTDTGVVLATQLKDTDGADLIQSSNGNTVQEELNNNLLNNREQWRRSLAEAGLTLVNGSFEEGATVNNKTDAVWHIAGGQCYTWDGAFPKAVPSDSTTTSTGGVGTGAWVSVGDASLRTDLSSSDGAGLIGVSSGGTVQGSLSDIKNLIKHAQPLSDRRIVAIAHRGYSETYLEQTLMAYSQCNADVLEVDMQTTSDGYAVCFHDNDLSPATVGGSGAVKDNTYSTVSALRFTRAVGTRYADMAGIPTLGSVCRIAMRRGKMLHAEIKGYRTLEDCALYSSIVNQYGLSPYTTFSCFDFAPLAYTHNINPRITYALELNSYDSSMDANIAELASWGGSVLSINKNILSTIGNKKLREWEAMGLTLAAWTIYTAEQMQTVANYGIRLVYLDKDFYNIIG